MFARARSNASHLLIRASPASAHTSRVGVGLSVLRVVARASPTVVQQSSSSSLALSAVSAQHARASSSVAPSLRTSFTSLRKGLSRGRQLNRGIVTRAGLVNTAKTPDLSFAERTKESEMSAADSATTDLEIKDPRVIFDRAIKEVERELGGRQNLRGPREIVFLGGAPGSGKGTQTAKILESRGLLSEPIVMSSLLSSPEMEAIKAKGGMINDFQVLKIFLSTLFKPENRRGVLVDGFPRTSVQIQCVKLLHDLMVSLRQDYYDSELRAEFPRPSFRVVVLFVEEDESVRRQMYRGQQAIKHNEKVKANGHGKPVEVRSTDLDADKASARYAVFKEHYDTLHELHSLFPFHLINAGKAIDEVRAEIQNELRYQSSIELSSETYDQLQNIPLATDLIAYARQELAQRLDSYQGNHPALFSKVVDTIRDTFFPVIRRHNVTGDAIIRSNDRLWQNPLAVDMAIDVLSERGFNVMADHKLVRVPDMVDQTTHKILFAEEWEYDFRVRFQAAKIREKVGLRG